ncbi:MAG: rRNA pseudouridine synthase [Planctomycetaceae bacterium]|nr:rRNA pseudouridine synthase [Planctomycetaceae bacterium]
MLESSDGTVRLQKFLANVGVASRRNCEEFIRNGRVTIDGVVVVDPAFGVQLDQDVRLDGERLRMPRYVYFVLNKPKGVLCTNKDPAGRPRAVDFVPVADQRVFTVGRLDENTQGLLLITNDGALAEHLAHPRYEVLRKYRAQVAGIPEPETMAELRQGMHFSDGFFRFNNIRLVKRQGRSAFLELELREGKNREIRRLLARVGHKVINLQRTAFGPLRLGNLAPGSCRELSPHEVRELYGFVESPGTHSGGSGQRRRTNGGKSSRKRSGPKGRTSRASGSRRGAARHGDPAGTARQSRSRRTKGAARRK